MYTALYTLKRKVKGITDEWKARIFFLAEVNSTKITLRPTDSEISCVACVFVHLGV